MKSKIEQADCGCCFEHEHGGRIHVLAICGKHAEERLMELRRMENEQRMITDMEKRREKEKG